MDDHIIILGTNALYAYEAAAGVRFDSGLIATMDVDLLWEVRTKLMLAIKEEGDPGDFIEVLRKDDLIAVEVMNLSWLLSSRKFEQVVIGQDGVPARMVVPDPRAFALHKFRVSQRDDREPAKKNRDASQALAVAQLVIDRLPQLKFSEDQLRMFPPSLVTHFNDFLEWDVSK